MRDALLVLGAVAVLIRIFNQHQVAIGQKPAQRISPDNPGTALITGASSGIGAAFARLLAAQGYNLILAARRETRLRSLAHEVQQRYAVTAEVLVVDLARSEDIERVEKRIAAVSDLTLLVNGAGFGLLGLLAESDLNKQLDMITVHVVASVRLAHAALPGMIARKHGAIINISSVGAFMHGPQNVTYCATKAYVNTFSQALQDELYETGLHVQALCPGLTLTEFHDSPEYTHSAIKSRIPRSLWMTADEVATASLSALWQGRVICIPGFKNRLIVALAQSGVLDLLLKLLLTRRARSLHQKTIPAQKHPIGYPSRAAGEARPPQSLTA
ncbi:MAG: SDR family oxidoreductase [Anaerolineae bacterium]|nr:SDR family oxidoreductase [Anaerolineae bacterium]